MQQLLIDWRFLLETNGSVLGLLLVFAGLALLLGGWRLERLTLVVVYAIAGAVAERVLIGDVVGPRADVLLGGAVAAGVGALLRKHAAPALAGFVAAGTAWTLLDNTYVPRSAVYIIVGLAFLGAAAPATAQRQYTTIVLSSIAGSALFASGLVAMSVSSALTAPHFRAMSTYGIFYPFLLLVPTVIGIFLQMSAVRRKDSGEVKF